jgi:serine phosphatase RsbU (regulator of sigma subunit)
VERNLPLVGLQSLLARERQERLDAALALREEHRIAIELQRGLLPKHLPDTPGLELVAHYEAAGRGADAGDGRWAICAASPAPSRSPTTPA